MSPFFSCVPHINMLTSLSKIFPLLCTPISLCFAQSWDTIPKWTDVYIRGSQGFKNLDYNLEFLMDNYDIISLEKCLNDGTNGHITVSYILNKQFFKDLQLCTGTILCECYKQDENSQTKL